MSFEQGPSRPERPEVWKRPDLLAEKGELIRVAKEFAPERDPIAFAQEMYKVFRETDLRDLSDEEWAVLENSDSWQIQPEDFETVAALAEKYGRDWEKFKRSLEEGAPIPAPTIVKFGDRLHKVGGNTRLMVARAMGIRPKVLIAEVQ